MNKSPNSHARTLETANRLALSEQSDFINREVVSGLDFETDELRILSVFPNEIITSTSLEAVFGGNFELTLDAILEDDEPSLDAHLDVEGLTLSRIHLGKLITLSELSASSFPGGYPIVLVRVDDINSEAASTIFNYLAKNNMVEGSMVVSFPLLFEQPEVDSYFDDLNQDGTTTIMRSRISSEDFGHPHVVLGGIPQDIINTHNKYSQQCRLDGMSIYTGVRSDKEPAFIPMMILKFQVG